jgi:hypothetical protein
VNRLISKFKFAKATVVSALAATAAAGTWPIEAMIIVLWPSKNINSGFVLNYRVLFDIRSIEVKIEVL